MLSLGLYRSAILESGTCDSQEFYRDYSDVSPAESIMAHCRLRLLRMPDDCIGSLQAVSWSNTYAKMVGCDPAKQPDLLGCLRKLETGKIMGSMLGPRPVVSSVCSWARQSLAHLLAWSALTLLFTRPGCATAAQAPFVPKLYPAMPW